MLPLRQTNKIRPTHSRSRQEKPAGFRRATASIKAFRDSICRRYTCPGIEAAGKDAYLTESNALLGDDQHRAGRLSSDDIAHVGGKQVFLAVFTADDDEVELIGDGENFTHRISLP